MFSRRLTKNERERLRAQRKEARLIATKAKERRFNYVINPPPTPKVVFGSGIPRETLPRSGPSVTPFMSRHLPEVRDYPGPFEYDTKRPTCSRKASVVGTSSFASKVPRIPERKGDCTPAVGQYDCHVTKPIKKAAKPFGRGDNSDCMIPKFLTPGPPTYPYHAPKKTYKLSMAFGGKRTIYPSVPIFCAPMNASKCIKCASTPVGDYYHHFSTNADMCRPCMNKELKILGQCTTDVFVRMRRKRELQQFALVRYCGFFHNHNGTTAAAQIMPTKTLRKKINIENYLFLFSKT